MKGEPRGTVWCPKCSRRHIRRDGCNLMSVVRYHATDGTPYRKPRRHSAPSKEST